MSGSNHVTVYLDGEARSVPKFVGGFDALRDALGIRRGFGVGLVAVEGVIVLGVDGEPGESVRVWDFEEGQKYRTLDLFGVAENLIDPKDDPADWWKL